jgi:hypothetical protein
MLDSDRNLKVLKPKLVLRVPMTAFRVKRQFTELLIPEMFCAAKGAKNGPGCVLNMLLRSWIKAGNDLETWAFANPQKFAMLREVCNQWRVSPFEGLVPERGGFKPTLSGPLGFDASVKRRDHTDVRLAYDTFAAFVLTSGMVTRIGLCDRCGDYYWNRWGHANKRFCGRECSQRKTATEGQARKISRQRREKNKKILQAVRKFIDEKPVNADWKNWVASRAGVTGRYLTRTYNRGLRGEPDGLKLTKRQHQYFGIENEGSKGHANL